GDRVLAVLVIVGLLPFATGQRYRFDRAAELLEPLSILKDAPEVNQVVVDVVDDFRNAAQVRHVADQQAGVVRVALKQDSATAEKRLHVVQMRRHQSHDFGREVMLAAMPLERFASDHDANSPCSHSIELVTDQRSNAISGIVKIVKVTTGVVAEASNQ